jgi:hypothetical protein
MKHAILENTSRCAGFMVATFARSDSNPSIFGKSPMASRATGCGFHLRPGRGEIRRYPK